MAAITADWREYERWNDVIADVVFPVTGVQAPAYLDLEDEVLEAIGSRLGLRSGDVGAELARVVAATCELGTTHAFALHLQRTIRWRQVRDATPPPILPLLSVFSLAAERMAGGSGMNSANYYGRLAELLGGKSDRLGPSYRNVAEPLWNALNSWLTLQGGSRGLPTAYSIGFRFVGLAISQALIREADRRRLERFFVDFDFTPRVAVPPTELEPLLDGWIGQHPSPATSHLTKLWGKTQLRARIAEVAATELAEWDGTDEASTDGHSSRSRVVLSLELTSFPARRLSLSPLFFAARPDESRSATLATTQGAVEVGLEPALNGALTFSDRALVDAKSLVEGELRLIDPFAGEIVRRPKRMVVFKKDELSGRWLEVRQVLMGDDVVALVASPALEKARSIIAEVARPGWLVVDSMVGLPEGWTLVRGVEIFARPVQPIPALSEFGALVPLTTSQLKLGGGLVLPSPGRNSWHVRRPPEIRAIDDSGEGVEVRLVDLGAPDDDVEEMLLASWTTETSGTVVVDLEGLGLDEGNYAIELVVGGGPTRARKELLLRSSAHPDVAQWAHVASVVHDASHPLVVLGADPDDDQSLSPGPHIQGVVLDPRPGAGGVELLLPSPWWKQMADDDSVTSISLARPEPGSCFYTGAHHEILDVAMFDSRGRPVEKFSTGRCKTCGLQRRYSSNYYQNKRKHERAIAKPVLARSDVSSIPAAQTEDNPVDWDLALDALRFLGGGPFSSLERVARQLDASSLFLHQFAGTLEALGHIEIRRSATTLEPLTWEICASLVVDAGDRRVLTGYWPTDMVAGATSHFSARGRRSGSDRQVGAPRREWNEAEAAEFADWSEFGEISVSASAGEELASVLPTMGALVEALPRRPAPALLGSQWFDPSRASWRTVAGTDGPGAYRLGKYGARYILRTVRDVADGTCASAGVSLAKHAASVLLTGRALASYDEPSAELTVPLGASLPGMYERAAVIQSGLAPFRRKGFTVYREVTPTLAGRLAYLLEN